MATWKPENSLLTQVGEDIFNKLKVGQGAKITISRIVAGSGRVAPSQLLKQTAISGSTKEFTINRVRTDEGGSELSFTITNTDFTEPYTLQQIGVFVTCDDYEGEQLYHISQCEEGDPDTIPAKSINPVTLGYSLYLTRANSNSFVVNIDPEGMVSLRDFEEFKNTITPLSESFISFKRGVRENKLITADSNGNLIASGKHTVRGSTLTVKDAVEHRALSLSVEGSSTQATPTPSSPTYLVNSKVKSITASNGSNPKTIALPSVIELRSLDDYADTIEWDGAKWWKVQRIAEVTVDGTVVSFGRPAHSNSSKYSRGTIYTLDSSNKVQTFNDALPTSPVLTSHGNTDSPSTTARFYGFLETVSGTSQIRVQLHVLHTAIGLQDGQKDASARLAEIVAWFKAQNTAGTPVKVWYVLNTPIVTEISLTEVLEMYANNTELSCSVEGNAVNMTLGYALNTTDSTTMYILKSLARKSDVQVANTFAIATLLE